MMLSILPLDLNAIIPLISVWLFTSIRISSFFISVPIFSHVAIPNYFKIILVLLISFIFTPLISQAIHNVPNILSFIGLLIIIKEIIIGFAMGLIFKILFEILSLVGEMVSTSMQLNFAQVYNPLDNSQGGVLSLFYQVFGMLVFVSIHGPLILISLLYKSYSAMPLGKGFVSHNQIKLLFQFSEKMFFYSLLLALSVMITLFIVNIGLMVISRLSTAFNVFTVGFAVTIYVGLITLIFSLPPCLKTFLDILKHTFQFVIHWQLVG